jgi:hypothetical protein
MEQRQLLVMNMFTEVAEVGEISNRQIKKYLNGIQTEQSEFRSLSLRLMEEVLARSRASMTDLGHQEDFRNSKKFHNLLLTSIGE